MATISEIVQASMEQATQKVAQQGQAVAPVVDWALQQAVDPQDADFDFSTLDVLADQLDGGQKVATAQQEAITPEEAEAEKIALAALALDEQQVAPQEELLAPIEVDPHALVEQRKVATQGQWREAIKEAANPIRWLGKSLGEGVAEAAEPVLKKLDDLSVSHQIGDVSADISHTVHVPGQEVAKNAVGFLARHPIATGAAAAAVTGAGGLLAGKKLEARKDPSQIMGGYMAGVSDEQAKDPSQMRSAYGMGLERGRQEGYAHALQETGGTKQAGLVEALARRFTTYRSDEYANQG